MDWQSVGMASAAAFFTVSGLQALAAAVALRRMRRDQLTHYALQRAAFEQRFQAVLKWARAAKPIFRAWAGERPFRVAAIIDEAIECKSFYLVPADGQPLPRFEPGQYLTFSLPVDHQRRPIVRCYSLSDRPREDYYRVTVKLVGPPNGRSDLPPGQSSSYFHQRVQVGGTLAVQAPQGAFFLDPTENHPVVLVGGGIGITPILGMASSIVHERTPRITYLFAGFRNSREHPFREPLAGLSQAKNVHVDVSYSQPLADDHLHEDYHHRGRVTVERLRQVLPSSNFRFYVCGPPGMMESLVPALRNWGVPPSHIFFEAFGPASLNGLINQQEHATPTQPCRIEFAHSLRGTNWNGQHPSILELAESEGIALDYGCRTGNCGQCLVAIRQGNVAHTKQPGVPLSSGECLTCIGVPQGDLVLEA